MHQTVPRCAHCGEVIGVYEPAVIVAHDTARDTSIAAEPSAAPDAAWHHRDCFPSAQGAA